MNSNNRVWILGSMLVSVAILAGGWFIGVAPMLALSAKADSDRRTVEEDNVQQELTLVDLQTRYAQLPEISGQLAALSVSMPATAEMANFLQMVTSAQAASETFVTDVSVADAVPYAPVIPEPVAAPVVEEGGDATADGEADAGAAADPAVAAVVPVLETAAIPGAESVTALNLTVIPVSVTASGTLDQVMAFTGRMQASERLFLVTALAITQEDTTKLMTVVVTGYLYVFGDPSGAVPVADGGTAPSVQ